MDIRANLSEPIVLEPLERCLIPTGLFLEIPEGYEAQIRPRSGLALKYGITLPNSPGTIDSDYRGELKILMINLSRSPLRSTTVSASLRWSLPAMRSWSGSWSRSLMRTPIAALAVLATRAAISSPTLTSKIKPRLPNGGRGFLVPIQRGWSLLLPPQASRSCRKWVRRLHRLLNVIRQVIEEIQSS